MEFGQTVQALQFFNSGDAVSCQVQHSQLAQVRYVFYLADLFEKHNETDDELHKMTENSNLGNHTVRTEKHRGGQS